MRFDICNFLKHFDKITCISTPAYTPNRKRLFESTVQMTGGYYSAQHGYSQRWSCWISGPRVSYGLHKQTDRRRLRPCRYYGQGRGFAHCRSVSAVSSGRMAIIDRRAWTTGRWGNVLVGSLCVIGHHQLWEMRASGDVYAVMRSEMHWRKLTGTHAAMHLAELCS